MYGGRSNLQVRTANGSRALLILHDETRRLQPGPNGCAGYHTIMGTIQSSGERGLKNDIGSKSHIPGQALRTD